MPIHNSEKTLNTTELIEDIYPLSPIQQGLLFHTLLSPELDVYFQQMIFSLESAIDVGVLASVWQRMAQRHSVFRTAFFWEGLDLSMQIVHSEANLPLDVKDLRVPAGEQKARIEQYLADDQKRGFNLSEPPLWRLALLRTADRQYKLILSFHHLLVDGWSIMLLLKEAKALYEASCRGVDLQLPPPRPYSDYIGWLEQQDLDKAQAWWRERLQGFSEVTALPLASAVRRPVQLPEHRFKSLRLSRAETTALESLCRQHQLTMNTVLLGAWGLLLGRHSGQADVVFGTTVSGRNPELAGVESMVGLFINTLPVRMQWDPEEPVVDWLKRVQREQAASYGLAHTPLVEIQGCSEIERGSQLFETLLVFQNYSTEAFEEHYGVGVNGKSQSDGRLKIVGIEVLDRVSYPLALVIVPEMELGLRLEYHASRFSEPGVERILQQLRQILQSMVKSGNAAKQKVREVKWMTEEERAEVIEKWNRTEEEIPGRCVHELFEEQAARTPEAVAVEYEEQQLTYTELNQQANQLARYLQKRGVGPEARVGIYLDRTENLVVGFLAVLKAGGVYVPLDPNYPLDRLNFLIEETGLQVLLTTSTLADSLPDSRISMIKLDQDWEIISQETPSNLPVNITPGNLSYVIYTSGSTGTPKGVQIEHRGMLNHLTAKISDLQLTAQDVVAETAPSSFDISVWQMLAVLLTGGRVHIVDGNIARDPFQLFSEMQRTGVTVLETVPAFLQMMVEGADDIPVELPKLRWMISNAEALPISLCEIWKKKYPGIPLLNAYGPTECSDDISHYIVSGLEEGLPYAPLGRPLMNTKMYVVDEEMEPVPVGVAGELYIGGTGVGRGYWKRGGLTAERFVPNPFTTTGERLYRTGDVVRQRPDGTLDFIGRRDYQVKIRGFRVELGEIESALLANPGVKQAVVIAREDQPGQKRLVAYLVMQPGHETVKTALLHASLQDRLPEYMVPSAYVQMEELPLNANGKVDRKRLPQPQAVEGGAQDRNARTVEEEILCGIWEQVLKVERVGVEENFFEVGGHSLLATQVVSRMREAFGVEIPLRIMFERPTLAGLAEAVKQARVQETGRTVKPLIRVENRAELPLSFAQQRLWFLDQLHPGSAAYNLPFGLRLEGKLDREALGKSFNELVRRHEALRTNFAIRDGGAVQVIAEAMEVKVEEIDLRGIAEEERKSETARHAQAAASQPFDLRQGALLRVKLLQLTEEEHVLLAVLHHIVSDGWSMDIIVREIARLYEATVKKEEAGLPELKVQYADYAVWQREWLTGEVLERQIGYWRKQLEGVPVLEMPVDYARGAVESQQGAVLGWGVEEELGQQLKELSRREGVTLFMVLLAAFQVLLSRYTQQEDIAVGTPIAGRTQVETDGLIGFFVNTLVMRSQLREGMSFRELLGQVRKQTLEAYEHQEVPFEKLVEELRPDRDLSRPPLFQVMFTFQNMPASELHLLDLKLSGMSVPLDLERFEMNLFAAEREGRIQGALSYRTNLFAESSMKRLLGHFECLLAELLNAPHKPLAEVTMMREEERQQVLAEWNQTAVEYPQRCVHELFEEQAARTPKAIALEYEGQTLTYGELNRRANQLGHYLRKLGVGPEVRVGICVERSLEMVIGLLGILKAGGAYVPLDPDYPPERLQFMAEDAQVAVLLTEKKFRDLLWTSGASEICLDEQWGEIAQESKAEVGVHLGPRHLAYVIFTSGSTGRPKGVGVEHRSIVRLVKGTNYVEVKEEDVFLQMAPVSFDAATFEIWGSLLNGCRLVVYPAGIPSLEELGVVVEKSGVTVLWLTAGLFHQMVDTEVKRLQGVRQLLAGGDVLSTAHARRVLAELGETCLINGYGPTENTTFSCCHRMSGEAGSELWGTVPIGRPITNSQAYVLDEEMRYEPMPVGIVGELYVGGEGLARGYMNRPELTAEKFVPNPFSERGGERLYRTGDRVRWRGDGSLEFVGRLDYQVKLRGYRIELGEIEAVLRGMAGVKDAAAVLREEEEGDKRLVAYVVMEGEVEEKQAEGEWRVYMKAKLPEYMVPSHFVVLEELPLTANGKLDRKALPAPVVDAAGTGEERESESPVEQIVAAMYEEVLGVEKVGAEADFFELGGHSLLATQVISRVRKVFEVELALRVLFENPTVRGMGREIQKQLQAGREGSGMGVEEPAMEAIKGRKRAPLSYAQQRLWFIDQLEPGSSLYNVPFALRLRGKLDKEALEKSLNEIVRRHEVLRTHFEEEEGEPVQVIVEDQKLKLEMVDLWEEGEGGEGEEGSGKEREERARRMAGEEARTPFDLSRGPLLRARLLRLGAEDYVLLVTMHHIVSDGWSIAILVREFSALYEGYVTGREVAFAELGVQYADFAVWQRKWLQGEVLEKQMKYWRGQLEGVAPLEVPTDYPRPAVATHRGAVAPFQMGSELTQKLRELSRQQGVTLFMTLLAGFQVLLARYSSQTDIAVGTDIANRNRLETEPLIGFFVNQLVLRAKIPERQTFVELLGQVRRTVLEAYAHQDLPFEELVEKLQPERDLSRGPLFQVKLAFQNAQSSHLRLPGLELEPFRSEAEWQAKLDLTVFLSANEGSIQGALEYSRDLFTERTVKQMARHWERLLEGGVEEAGRDVWSLALLSDEERREVVEGRNQTRRAVREGGLAPERFQRQAAASPDAIAVVAQEQKVSYAQLNERANQLAHYLKELGVGPEVRVGICMGRTAELIIAMLAVWKAGGAYLPLDLENPGERVVWQLEDAGAGVLLTETKVKDRLPAMWVQTICVDQERGEISQRSRENPESGVEEENLAYVMYTSGSSGRPKGVGISHRGLENYLEWSVRKYPVGEGRMSPVLSSPAFDLTITSIFPALLAGGTLLLLEEENNPVINRLMEGQKRLGTIKLTPAHLQLLRPWAGGEKEGRGEKASRMEVEALVIGGEALSYTAVKEWREEYAGTRLINEYGPTETVVGCSTYEIGQGDEESGNVPIGEPIWNTRMYIVDRKEEPVPAGVAGELYIGGKGLARCYLNQAGMTAEKFVPDGLSGERGERLYRTGDRARWRADGKMEYLGRLDQQVKIRGYRIELGEIEAVLQEQAGVAQAVVEVQEDSSGDKRLVAYLVGAEDSGNSRMELNSSELRKKLRGRLPEYMVPSAYVQIAELPLTSNGKLDRKRLPRPESAAAIVKYRVPGSVEEEILCGIWEQLLRVERVGIEENFFEMGGHSLLATQVVSRVREAFGVEIPLRILFEQPTVAGLAKAVKQARVQEGSRAVTPLVRVENRTELPLSYAQQRLWFLEQLEPGNAVYNVPYALRIRGELDREALIQTFRRIVERHEVLRTVFVWNREQEPVQRVLSVEEAGVVAEVTELRESAPEQREAEARRLAGMEAGEGFNLNTGPLLRVKLLGMGEQDHVLLVTMHHIVSDGWSVGVLMRDFTEIYKTCMSGHAAQLPEMAIQYADYALWQRDWLRGQALEQQLGYWRKQLQSLQPLELPADHPRPAVATNQGREISVRIGADLTHKLRELGRRENATLFMVVLGAFQVLLGRYSGQTDLAVGSPIANRSRAELENLVGFFTNTLVLRIDLSGKPRFLEVLQRVREMTLGAYEHQDLPFENLVAELEPERHLSRAPLFQVMFSFNTAGVQRLELPGLTLEPIQVSTRTAKFDLLLSLAEEATGIEATLQYSTDLFEESRMEKLLCHFQMLLEGIVSDPHRAVDRIPILSAEELQELHQWNCTEAEYPQVCLHELFEEQARETPQTAAVVFGNQQLSYRELDDKANRLARHLRSLGVGPDVRVGICMERCLEMIVGVLGVLKAGGAYVPLDPSYPGERLAFMLHDSCLSILLTQKGIATALPQHDVRALYLDREWQEEIGLDSSNGDNGPHSFEPVTPDHLAYVIYTSGSTGKPKGVAMPHRPLVNLFVWQRDSLNLQRRPRTLQFSPLSFDASANEAFTTWAMGGTLVLISEEQRRDPAALVEFLNQQQIDSVYLPFVALQQIADECQRTGRYPVRLREVLSTAEPLQITRNVARFFSELPFCRLHNEYGPSETHVVSAWMAGGSVEEWPAWPPIGRPIANTQLYILDQEFYPTPVGVPGNLYIGGDNVARGYVGRPELTAQRFIPDPFSRTPGARFYDTGDQAVYRPDANIRFLGRADQQVKLRGYRIELGEIESALEEHPGVQQSAVVMQQDANGERQLTAFILIKEESHISWEQLRLYLQQKLPDYMVPAAGTFVATLPMTPSGKVDRKKLRETALVRSRATAEPVTPRNPAEKLVAEIWGEALHRSDFGVETNFFEIGGHSLQATQIIARIRTAFQIEKFPLRRIFQTPTIAGLVRGVEEAVGGESVAQTIAEAVQEIRALSPEQVEAMFSSNQLSE